MLALLWLMNRGASARGSMMISVMISVMAMSEDKAPAGRARADASTSLGLADAQSGAGHPKSWNHWGGASSDGHCLVGWGA